MNFSLSLTFVVPSGVTENSQPLSGTSIFMIDSINGSARSGYRKRGKNSEHDSIVVDSGKGRDSLSRLDVPGEMT